MNRRDFLILSGVAPMLSGSPAGGTAAVHPASREVKDLLAIVSGGDDPVSSLGSALKSFGGIHKLVPKRSKVLVKPAIALDKRPGNGFNSDPELVRYVVELCYKAGAREVSVFDHTFDDWRLSYKNSGIERQAKDAAARVLPANEFRYYQSIPETTGNHPGNLHTHFAMVNADVIINMASARQDDLPEIRGALHNYTGCLWERYSCTDQDNCISRLLSFRKPDLTVTELWPAMQEGFKQETFQKKNNLIVSRDPVLADQILTEVFNTDNEQIKDLTRAILAGHGYEELPAQRILYAH